MFNSKFILTNIQLKLLKGIKILIFKKKTNRIFFKINEKI